MNNDKELFVIALGADGTRRFSEYVLVAEGYDAVTTPIVIDGQIAVVTKWGLLYDLLEVAPVEYREYGSLPKKPTVWINIERVVSIIRLGEEDHSCEVLNFINIYLYFLTVAPMMLPPSMKRVLWALADYTTFETDIGAAYKSGL